MPPKRRRHSVRKRKTITRPRPRPPAPSRIRGNFEEVIARAFALDAKRHGRYPSLKPLERALRLVWDALSLVDDVVDSASGGRAPEPPQLNFDGVLEDLRDRLGVGSPRASPPSPMSRSVSFPAVSLSSDLRLLSDGPADANQTVVPSAAPPSAITISAMTRMRPRNSLVVCSRSSSRVAPGVPVGVRKKRRRHSV